MTSYRAFGASSPPTNAQIDDTAYTFGLEIYAVSQAWITHIHWFQPSTTSPSNAIRKATIYRVLTNITGVKEFVEVNIPTTNPGWNSVQLPTPFQMTIGQRYKICVLYPAGRYSFTASYFSSGPGSTEQVVGPCRVCTFATSTSAFGQNTFVGNSVVAYPESSMDGNIWIDFTVSDTNPAGGGLATIADRARSNMLTALALAEPQKLSNVDLMSLVVSAGGLGLITVNSQTPANHYLRYLKILRDS